MPQVHPSASVSREAILADDVQIGPMCIVEGRVTLGRGVRLIGNVYLHGPMTIGDNTIVYPFACLGFPPQDYKFKPGDRTAGVEIGSDCIIREHVTVHAATSAEKPTRVGSGVFLMVNAHLGHDVSVGNKVVMVNNAAIAGHAQIGDGATLSGAALIHQFNRVGRLAFVSGASAVTNELPPFCVAWGRNQMIGINLVGLRRSGMPREHITQVRRAYREAFRSRAPKAEALAILREIGNEADGCPPVMEMAEFVATAKRPITDALARESTDSELT